MSVAVYPGSFDPITHGHTSIIRSGLVAFEKIVVAVLNNPRKSPLFTVDERIELIRESMAEMGAEDGQVEVDRFDGLLVDYCRHKGARIILRGLRAVADFEYELQMANMNRHLNEEVETVFIMADDAYFYVSSNLIKEAAKLGGDVDALVPKPVAERLRAKLG
ncbi:MAG TPA: pantetheine-phosphate adenylyltransferase [Polyangiaceae bacterium LLY-WYZ-15_(1-7)]|nr:pantetheine-phosphate adenylyltransferase [Myxococcales bacterium]MAT28870.1 pantetheine-phosphate adenylyltransferase [Sandaracinus sp.]HJK94285.1 pantetheine-phosphate adenylyltransferase [Polyangiaceae bacterium LLY-WYZ-15_(1-7)]HJL06786.1 pantetheine-phosphate adenylyltransferase [Polyangiaceae bacterium LLY-WYZ-15_(1-7)]HJL12053.1 pantetheine-phosphate adenylyltransferase [Polyangiaceae bacterium LLY-WYZ-15_(1-7)]